MRCVKTANLKFTQLCPKQAHIDYMPVANTSRALGPRCCTNLQHSMRAHKNTHFMQDICSISHTLVISVCLTEKEAGALPSQQDKHLQKCVTQVVTPWTLSASSRRQPKHTKLHITHTHTHTRLSCI